jgi:hypothetical protein
VQPQPIALEFVAIEAKLRDWRRALFQAARHRSYAHQSWVLLDSSSALPAIQNLARFRTLNIGLATASRSGAIHIRLRPRSLAPFDPIALWHANFEVLSRLQALKSPKR